MSTKYQITDNAVNQHSSNLGTAVESFNGNLSKFGASISNLEGSWQGTSYSSWTELTTAFNDAFANLNKQLEIIQTRMSNAGQIYDQGQQEQTQNFQNLHGSANWSGTKAHI